MVGTHSAKEENITMPWSSVSDAQPSLYELSVLLPNEYDNGILVDACMNSMKVVYYWRCSKGKCNACPLPPKTKGSRPVADNIVNKSLPVEVHTASEPSPLSGNEINGSTWK